MGNKNRVLYEWYQLFKKQHHILSDSEYKHWQYVMALGFPNFKRDYWKYNVFEEFLKNRFVFHEQTKLNVIERYKTIKLAVDGHMVVFVNGKFSSELSDTTVDPWILEFDRSSKRYNIFNPVCPDMFLYLTECLSHFLVKITLPRKAITKKPLYLLYITEGSDITDQLITSHYYYIFNIEPDTESCIIEHFVSFNNGGYFNGARALISVGSRSKLEHIKLIFENEKSYHISHQDIHSEKHTNISSNTFIIGPKFTHHQVNAKIDYEQVSLSLNSLSLLSQKKIGNIYTYLEHNSKDYSESRQLHKIIATDHSTGMFTGLIKVNKDAIKTDAKMVNNNLLLDQYASIYSVPQLEIYSDAVQCSHGSTTGKLNPDHLFYLNTRGISIKNAMKMLTSAFVLEVTRKVKFFLLKKVVDKRINQDLMRSI